VRTYAQNFEDVMLARLFGDQSDGFYIDVGAWHPTMHSVTRHFYDLGWRGVNVEPVYDQHALFVADRPDDINLRAAVGSRLGTLRFFECSELTSLSTADPAQAAQLEKSGYSVKSYDVDVITLADIGKRIGHRPVDFLKVDVEGFEAQVLKGVDWQAFRPRVLVIEATLPDTRIVDWDNTAAVNNWADWEPNLLASGYVFALFDGLSRFYLRSEEVHLAGRLTIPPCVHDDIHRWEEDRICDDLSLIEADRQEKSAVIERLLGELSAVRADQAAIEADRQEKSAVIERLLGELSAVRADQAAIEADRQEKSAVIERLLGELSAVRADQAAIEADRKEKSAVIERLLGELSAVRANQASKERRIESNAVELKQLHEQLRQLKANVADTERGVAKQISAHRSVIAEQAANQVERKASLAGWPDLLLRWRHSHVPTRWGKLIRPAGQGHRHIALDVLEIVFGVSGGVETYMKMLTAALLEGGYKVTLICLPEQRAALEQSVPNSVGLFQVRVSSAINLTLKLARLLGRGPTRASTATSMATFHSLAQDLAVDVLHSPVQIFSVSDFSVPSVLNLHDLQHLHFPENFRPSDIEARNLLYGRAASLATAIVVSSDFVKEDLISKMAIPREKVFTVPVTWDPKIIDGLGTFDELAARARYNLPATYAIYPAQFWPHKNHVRLIEALAIVRQSCPEHDLKLVLTGYRGHTGWSAVKVLIDELALQSDVLCLDHVPVEHLAALYKGSVFCVMPSTFEASSYPIIEAQVLGVPAMCSNVTSLPELMRDGAGLLFDPFDAQDIARKMIEWLRNPADRQAHADRAILKAQREHSLDCYVAGLDRVYSFVTKGVI
jgi:FkbM family methyltransferase